MSGGLRLPTRRADWRLVGRTVRLVLGMPGYAVLALFLALTALSLFVFSRQLSLLRFVLSSGLPLEARVTILSNQYPFLGPGYEATTGVAVLVVAGLTGVNLAVVTYHVREHGLSRGSGTSAVGVFLGLLGAGCAACGTAILAGLLSLVGAAGLVTALPLEGLELSGLAVVVLLLSLYWLAEGLRGGEIRGCPVDVCR